MKKFRLGKNITVCSANPSAEIKSNEIDFRDGYDNEMEIYLRTDGGEVAGVNIQISEDSYDPPTGSVSIDLNTQQVECLKKWIDTHFNP